MEHLAGGGDRRARGLRRVARLLAHGPLLLLPPLTLDSLTLSGWRCPGQTVRYLPLIPGSRFSPLLMAGHAPQSDRPTRIARLVEQTAARAATLRGVAQPLSPGDSSALR